MLKRDGPRHKFEHKDHEMRKLTEDEMNRELMKGAPTTSGEYVFDFGKHKKKSLSWVQAHAPSYITWLLRDYVYEQPKHAHLKKALRVAGLLDAASSVSSNVAPPVPVADGQQRSDAALPVAVADAVPPVAMAVAACPHKAAEVAHRKYMAKHQRTDQYMQRPAKRACAPVARGLLELQRMSSVGLTLNMRDDGILEDLQGRPCPYCQEGGRRVWGKATKNQSPTIGKLTWSNAAEVPGSNITRENVCHRCICCRARIPVTYGNALFEQAGKGSYGASYSIFAQWMEVEGYSVTHVARALNVAEATARRWMDVAQAVMAADAWYRQEEIVFGHLDDNATADIEADETVFGHWKEARPGLPAIHHWWIWLAVKQRGGLGMWMKDCGVRSSMADERGAARPPQLRVDEWVWVMNKLFDEDTRAVLMSDMCPVFVNTSHCGIVDKHQVNHSEHEFIRSVEVLANVVTRQMRPGMAGTQMLDREFGVMKGETVTQGKTAATPQGRARLTTAIRASQWRRMVSTSDRWPEYCRAVHRMRQGKGKLNPTPWPCRLSEREWVASLAGGLAMRCQHIAADTGRQCNGELHMCCVACNVPLCAAHSGCHEHTTDPVVNARRDREQSRCHEHTTDPVVASFCPCQECMKIGVVLDA